MNESEKRKKKNKVMKTTKDNFFRFDEQIICQRKKGEENKIEE